MNAYCSKWIHPRQRVSESVYSVFCPCEKSSSQDADTEHIVVWEMNVQARVKWMDRILMLHGIGSSIILTIVRGLRGGDQARVRYRKTLAQSILHTFDLSRAPSIKVNPFRTYFTTLRCTKRHTHTLTHHAHTIVKCKMI